MSMFDPVREAVERIAVSRCKLCRAELAHDEGWCSQICDGCEIDLKQDENDRAAELEAEERETEEYARE